MMLAERYPNDPGALVSLLLNRVDLSPGEAIFLAAGTLHAYLGGVGLELMANSDNVIRAGCTSKHIDTTELLRVGRFAPAPPTTVTPIGPEDGATVWAPPVEELRLTRLDIDDQRTVTAAGPQIWLCLTGSAVLTSDRYPTLDLTRGQSVFKAADSGARHHPRPPGNGVLRKCRARLRRVHGSPIATIRHRRPMPPPPGTRADDHANAVADSSSVRTCTPAAPSNSGSRDRCRGRPPRTSTRSGAAPPSACRAG